MDRFRRLMEERWRDFERQGIHWRDGNVVTQLAVAWYRDLAPADKDAADQVLSDWLLHGTSGQQFDAIALIRKFRIHSAESALRQLATRLAGVPGPVAQNQREKVLGVIDVLTVDDQDAP